MHWHAAQDSNLDLSVLEADALTIKLATHSLLAAGAGLEPAQHAMVVRISNALPYRLGQPAFGGRGRNRTYKLSRGVGYSHLGPLRCPTRPYLLWYAAQDSNLDLPD